MDNNQNQINHLKEQLKNTPPKIIGGYKKPGWALKVLDKISNDAVETEPDGKITAKGILEAKDKTYYPAFLTLDMSSSGQIAGVYFISETSDQFELLPFELIREFIGKTDSDLLPFKYRTLEKIEGDQVQINWPDFT
ncbi:hypothetical protein ACN6MY_00300 [Peribacillus sp. B-H-3]|uniref:hypothetical protein n=1 Tax=Peribacillus sp. B-H-3 TaxID=3400420 RepID=UPI003B02213C